MLGIFTGVWHLVDLPVQVALSGAPEGPTGPIGAFSGVLWVLATSIALVARPTSAQPVTPPAHPEAALAG